MELLVAVQFTVTVPTQSWKQQEYCWLVTKAKAPQNQSNRQLVQGRQAKVRVKRQLVVVLIEASLMVVSRDMFCPGARVLLQHEMVEYIYPNLVISMLMFWAVVGYISYSQDIDSSQKFMFWSMNMRRRSWFWLVILAISRLLLRMFPFIFYTSSQTFSREYSAGKVTSTSSVFMALTTLVKFINPSLLVRVKEGLATVVGCRPDIRTEQVPTTLPLDSLQSNWSWLLGQVLPGLSTEDRVKLKAEVVVATAKRLLAVRVFPLTEQGTGPPEFEQEEQEKAGPLRELLHLDGNFRSREPAFERGTFGLGVTVNVQSFVAVTVVLGKETPQVIGLGLISSCIFTLCSKVPAPSSSDILTVSVIANLGLNTLLKDSPIEVQLWVVVEGNILLILMLLPEWGPRLIAPKLHRFWQKSPELALAMVETVQPAEQLRKRQQPELTVQFVKVVVIK